MKRDLKIIGVIPAHLNSVRFRRKILHDILGIPMIEHVRRRAIKSGFLNKVYVASGDNEILDVVSGYGGSVLKTIESHSNGTSRVAESIKSKDCSHVLIIQGDEPLIQFNHIKNMVDAIAKKPNIDAFNSISKLLSEEELSKINTVKAAINEQNRILYCFRKSPSYSDFINQKNYIRKIQGLIAFKKNSLLKISKLPAPQCEIYESIEQLRIISHGLNLFGVFQDNQVPSINEKIDLDEYFLYLENNNIENRITQEILQNKY